MKYSLLLIVFLMASVHLFAQDDEDIVKGGFKTCTVYSYTYVSGKFDSKSKSKQYIAKYNNKGLMSELHTYSSDGKIESTELNTFDDQGNKIQTIKSKEGGNQLVVSTHEYNHEGKRIKTLYYNTLDKSIQTKSINYEYNWQGKLIVQQSVGADGTAGVKTVFLYDDNGNNIRKIIYSSTKAVMFSEGYKYDDKGNMTQVIMYKGDSTFSMKKVFKYDSQQNLTEEEQYASEDIISKATTYKYDTYGNRIEYIEYEIEHKGFDNISRKPISKEVYVYAK